MSLGFHHHAILATDLAAAEAFYVGVLGLKVQRRWLDHEGKPRSFWLTLGNGFLAIERTEKRPAPGGHHCFAMAIAASERGSWMRRLAEAGVPPEKQSDHSIYVRDPDGNLIALSHWPEARKSPTPPG